MRDKGLDFSKGRTDAVDALEPCADCKRPVWYDYSIEDWRHADGKPCGLHPQ